MFTIANHAMYACVVYPLLIDFFFGNVHPTRHQIEAMTKWKFFTRLTTSSRKSEICQLYNYVMFNRENVMKWSYLSVAIVD